MYKDVTVTKCPQNNQHFGCYIQKQEKNRQKFIGFAPLGAHQEANGLMDHDEYHSPIKFRCQWNKKSSLKVPGIIGSIV